MANVMTDRYLDNNKQYASGQAVHKPVYPGKQPIQPSKGVAVLACMDARLDVEDLLDCRRATPTSSATRGAW